MVRTKMVIVQALSSLDVSTPVNRLELHILRLYILLLTCTTVSDIKVLVLKFDTVD
jgi:hypothetical protein